MMKKPLRNALKWTILAGLLLWIFQITDFDAVRNYLLSANPLYVGLFVISYLIGMCISAAKWSMISSWFGFSERFTFFGKTYVIATFLNNFLPSFLGGDAYRSYALAQHSGGTQHLARATITVVGDRLTGLLVIVCLAAVSIIPLIALGYAHPEIIVLALVLWGIIGWCVIGFLLRQVIARARIVGYIPQSVQMYISALMTLLAPGRAAKLGITSAAFAGIGIALANYMLFLALGVEISLLQYMSVIFVIVIVSSIPISVGNIGIKEAAYIYFFGLFGVPVAACVSIVILSRLLQLIVSLLGVPFYLTSDIKTQKS